MNRRAWTGLLRARGPLGRLVPVHQGRARRRVAGGDRVRRDRPWRRSSCSRMPGGPGASRASARALGTIAVLAAIQIAGAVPAALRGRARDLLVAGGHPRRGRARSGRSCWRSASTPPSRSTASASAASRPASPGSRCSCGLDTGGGSAALVGGLMVVLASLGYALGAFWFKRRLAGPRADRRGGGRDGARRGDDDPVRGAFAAGSHAGGRHDRVACRAERPRHRHRLRASSTR